MMDSFLHRTHLIIRPSSSINTKNKPILKVDSGNRSNTDPLQRSYALQTHVCSTCLL
ncbi:unnamed protein product [Cuscuta europaea]|uniref:Uncharacterized protein n=1 Tax=Cuscuta europaea TaxID=41803 RepID=A0A9P0ZFF5_CUSEU|nr:unnamed protein product [Cuscuta europaea]